MTQPPFRPRNWALSIALCAGLLVAGGLAGWFWGTRSGAAPGSKAAIEKIVHDYILANPEILPQAIENLTRKETSKRLSGIRAAVETPFPGAVLGNPQGKVTLVEFTDFACGYCRQAVADVEALIAENPDLRVVIRELPVLSPESAEAARWALAAAQQGRYHAFHNGMYAAGHPSADTIQAAAKAAGLDLARAKQASADPRIEAELKRNFEFAQQLGFAGTPAWVIGDQTFSGAVGKAQLGKAIAEARKAGS